MLFIYMMSAFTFLHANFNFQNEILKSVRYDD